MSKIHLILPACFLLALVCGARAGPLLEEDAPSLVQNAPKPEDIDIKALIAESKGQMITVESHGKTISIPRFRPEERMTDARYEFDNKVIKEITEKAKFISSQILIKNVYPWTLTKNLFGVSGTLYTIFKDNKALKEVDASPRLRSGLGIVNGEMLVEMLRSGDYQKLEDREAQERIEVVMDAAVKIVKESSTGLVLVWPEMTIDGQKLAEYLRPVLKKLTKRSLQLRGILFIAVKCLYETNDD